MDDFMERLKASLDPRARQNFMGIDQMILRRGMTLVGWSDYPSVTGDPSGERACGDCACSVCGHAYAAHPMDWRVIGYGDVPFLNVLCDGTRVKL